jgi:hypothetical protein
VGTRYTGYFSTGYSTTDGKLSPGEVSPARSTTAEPRTPILVEGWAKNTKTGRLLCPRHHALAHDPTYPTNPTAHGELRFVKRT